jgi:hypothetical protein
MYFRIPCQQCFKGMLTNMVVHLAKIRDSSFFSWLMSRIIFSSEKLFHSKMYFSMEKRGMTYVKPLLLDPPLLGMNCMEH